MGNIIKVDFTRRWSQSLDQLIGYYLQQGTFPGVEVLFAQGEEILLHKTWGLLEVSGDRVMPLNTIFDLASLTKPVATASLLLLLQEQGMLDLEEPVSTFLPEFGKGEKSEINLLHLLTHTSGLPAWANLYQDCNTEAELRKQLFKLQLENPVGKVVVYSCIGYLILGEIIRKVTGASLSNFFETSIALPLGLQNSYFSPAKKGIDVASIAPTQYCPWRKKLLRGIVHDENSFMFGEEGGNAGLFSTAIDLHRFCCMLLNDGEWKGIQVLTTYSVQQMLRNHHQTPLLPRALGWDYKEPSNGYWSCGFLFPSGAVGHTGFTGTSLWMDPISQWIVIVLSNRIHLSRDTNLKQMHQFRPRLHNLLLSMM